MTPTEELFRLLGQKRARVVRFSERWPEKGEERYRQAIRDVLREICDGEWLVAAELLRAALHERPGFEVGVYQGLTIREISDGCQHPLQMDGGAGGIDGSGSVEDTKDTSEQLRADPERDCSPAEVPASSGGHDAGGNHREYEGESHQDQADVRRGRLLAP